MALKINKQLRRTQCHQVLQNYHGKTATDPWSAFLREEIRRTPEQNSNHRKFQKSESQNSSNILVSKLKLSSDLDFFFMLIKTLRERETRFLQGKHSRTFTDSISSAYI